MLVPRGKFPVKIKLLAPRLARLAGRSSLIAVAAASFTSIATAAPVNGWSIPITDVVADPSIRLGTLSNGLRYAVMRNATPRGSASLRMQFAFGSIGEGEKERGLAHFIEHLAFNGTTHVPEGEMVKILERQGLAFGPDTNAQTGFDTTTYMLDLPATDTTRLDTAFMLMRETASEQLITQGAVDRERGVILGEKRFRDSFQLRQAVDLLGFQAPNTPYANRLPIGTVEVLNTANSQTIRDLYHRYYRPENTTVIFVGDADPALIEARIVKTFSDWKGVGQPGVKLSRGTVDLARPTAFHSFIDPSVPTIVDLTIERPWTDPADTLTERRNKLLEGIVTTILNRRIERLSNEPGSPLLGGAVALGSSRDAARSTTFRLAAKDGAWTDALTSAESEYRRAAQYGVTKAELSEQLANIASVYRTAAEQADTRTNQVLAANILSTIDDRAFVTTPAARFAFFNRVAPTINIDEVNATLRRLLAGSAPLVLVSGKAPVALADVQSRFAALQQAKIDPPKGGAAAAFAYESFGAEGKVVSDTRVADLGIRTVRFSNNVRLNLKRTDFEMGKVRFIVRMGGGMLELPAAEPGLGVMMTLTSGLGATARQSLGDLKQVLAGKTVTPGAIVSDDAFVATGTTTSIDLSLQLKLSAAYLTDPGYRPEAASQWSNLVPVISKQLSSQPQIVAQTRLPVLLANGDQRFGIPDAGTLTSRSFAEAKAATAAARGNGPIEIGIVGDIDEAAAITAVAKSFGSLPPRLSTPPSFAAARKVAFRADHAPIRLTHTGSADQALVGVYWPTDDDRDFRKEVGMTMLSNVLRLMLTDSVREKLGDSYGAAVASSMSDVYDHYGTLGASAVVAPGKANEVRAAILDAAESLRTMPVSADLLARAKNPELEQAQKALRDNGYWLGGLAEAQTRPSRLNRLRQRQALVQAVTPATIQSLARQYLSPAKAQDVLIVSETLAAK